MTGQADDPTDNPPNFIDDQHTVIVVDEVEIEGHEGNPNELGVACWTVKAPGAGTATRGGAIALGVAKKEAPELPKRLYVIEHPPTAPSSLPSRIPHRRLRRP